MIDNGVWDVSIWGESIHLSDLNFQLCPPLWSSTHSLWKHDWDAWRTATPSGWLANASIKTWPNSNQFASLLGHGVKDCILQCLLKSIVQTPKRAEFESWSNFFVLMCRKQKVYNDHYFNSLSYFDRVLRVLTAFSCFWISFSLSTWFHDKPKLTPEYDFRSLAYCPGHTTALYLLLRQIF